MQALGQAAWVLAESRWVSCGEGGHTLPWHTELSAEASLCAVGQPHSEACHLVLTPLVKTVGKEASARSQVTPDEDPGSAVLTWGPSQPERHDMDINTCANTRAFPQALLGDSDG